MAKSAKKPTSKKSSKKPTYTKANPKPAVRKVAAPASSRSRSTTAARTSGGGVQPMSVSLHTYRIASKPAACEDWAVGDYFEVYVSNPPPSVLIFEDSNECDGTRAAFIE